MEIKMNNKRKVISLRLGKLEEEVSKICEKENLTESELLKKALVEYLIKSRDVEEKTSVVHFKVFHNRIDEIKKRIEISLTVSEIEALDELMKISIHSTMQSLIVGILRAYFLHSPVFQINEVVNLKKANSELNSIGRNLNQMSKLSNMNEVFAEDVLTQNALNDLTKIIENHSQYVREVINTATLRTKFYKE